MVSGNPPSINVWMALEPVLTAYIINPSHQSVSVCVSLLALLDKGSVKTATNICNNRTTVRSVSTYRSIKTFPRKRRIVGSAVFCAVRVVSKDRRPLVIPRTSCSVSHKVNSGLEIFVKTAFSIYTTSAELSCLHSCKPNNLQINSYTICTECKWLRSVSFEKSDFLTRLQPCIQEDIGRHWKVPSVNKL
jgi:hypothetical protein